MIAGMLAVLLATVLAPFAPSLAMGADDVEVRREVEEQYPKLVEAYNRQDRKAFMRLLTGDFHAMTADGRIHDVRGMEGFSESDKKNEPVRLMFTIREFAVSEYGLIAVVEVFREMRWMRELAGTRRTVSISDVRRHTWSKTRKGWKLKSVDHIRDEKRFVNGKRVDPTKRFDPDAPPYEPVEEGASAAIPGEGVTGTETIDALLAHALVTQLDAMSALNSTGSQLRKPNGLAQGVPPYLYASAKGISGDMEELKAVYSGDPNQEGVRKRLLERLKNLGEAVDLLMQAVRAAGAANGWTPEANDAWSKSWESYWAGPPVDSLEIRVFSGSPTIRNALPRDALTFAGIVQDSCGYGLGVVAWVNAPMRIASVSKDSYAEQLGLQAGDEIISIGGRAFESMTALKWYLAALAGKRVDMVVKRDAGNVTLHPKVPRFPASDIEIRRELEQQYQELVEAHGLQDHKAIATMYTADFDAILSDRKIIDVRAIKEWYEKERKTPVEDRYIIQELAVSENRLIAVVEVFRELKWMDKLAGTLRTVSVSEMERQTWSRTREGWKMKSADNIRDEKRFVDGKRVNPDPTKPFDPDAPPYEPPAEKGKD